MRKLRFVLAAVSLTAALSLCAQQPEKKEEPKKPNKTEQPKPAPAKAASSPAKKPAGDPIISGLDKSVDPCVDFYQFACGGWRAANPIPSDRSRYGRFTELYENNQRVLRTILEEAAKGGSSRNAVDQKIGDFYSSCMDEEAVDKKRMEPLKEAWGRIDALSSKDGLTDLITYLHKTNTPGFFSYYSQPDLKNASTVIANFDQGGISLPSRDYYTDTDDKSKEIRAKYVQHVQNMLTLAGYSADQAKAGAEAVMKIETALAESSLTPVEQRDPKIQYHIMSIADFEKQTPAIKWSSYISGVGTPNISTLNVAVPKFAEGLEKTIENTSLDDLKTYMKWHLVHDAAPVLSKDFVTENFNFYQKELNGTKEEQPRWKRCVTRVDDMLGEALGIAYVKKTFGPDAKKRTLDMVGYIESAMSADVNNLDWMSQQTKQAALVKLKAVANKIGYPDKWRDYSSVKIVPGDFYGNVERASEFEFQRQLNKIGKPTDKTEWGMTPPTVNAYYNPLENNINFPAGILQPPFYYKDKDDAINFGAAGVVVGHELTHGFDDQGRQFDAEGNLRDWWTPEDNQKFEERAKCIVDEYSAFQPIEGVNLNGKLTLGENGADNAGAQLAWMALMENYKHKRKPGKIDGYTPEQRFFIGFGQMWCENKTDQTARNQAKVDPHSPGRFRTNGVVTNMTQFQQAFSCKAGQPMAPEKRCRVW